MDGVRICCNVHGRVGVGLRPDGARYAPVVPILPQRVQGAACAGDPMEWRQLEAKEQDNVRTSSRVVARGFRVVPLASDYLCQVCLTRFEELDVSKIEDADVLEWIRRLQLAGPFESGLRWGAQKPAETLLRDDSSRQVGWRGAPR